MDSDQQEGEEKNQEFFQVEKIIECKIRNNRKYYQIKWVGYPSKDNTWEPIENLANVLYMVDEYEAKKKAKSGKINLVKGKKRDLKRKDKESVDFEDLKDSEDPAPRSGPEFSAASLNIITGDIAREGAFEVDEPEKIMGVVEQVSAKEWKMKIKWKKDAKTGKRPK